MARRATRLVQDHLWLASQTVTYFNPVVYLINGLRYAFYGVSDFNIWISVSSMVFFLIICVTAVSVLLKKGYKIKS